jgi:hypothetical protein
MFQPGNTYGQGRPKGSTNKSNVKVKEAIDSLLEGHMESFARVMNELAEDPRSRFKYAKLVTELMEYSIPKLKAVESTVELGEGSLSKITIEVKNGSNTQSDSSIPTQLG